MDLLREPAEDDVRERPRDALDQSAVLELPEALALTDVDDQIRTATETFYQA